MNNIRILFTEKAEGYNNEERELKYDFKNNLNIKNLKKVRLINRYTIEGLKDDEYEIVKDRILSEKNLDMTWSDEFKAPDGTKCFCVEYLKGQYDQRADSANQCIQIITGNFNANVTTSKIIALYGNVTSEDVEKIKKYYINPVDSCEIDIFNNQIQISNSVENKSIPIIDGFINSDDEYIKKFHKDNNLAMSIEDLKFLRDYFKNEEKRNPTMTEIKVIDTYWSDHCRHTTFSTVLNFVEIEDGKYNEGVKKAVKLYENARSIVYKDRKKDVTLMDIATIGMKEAFKEGKLSDIDRSEEINAASIKIKVDVDNEDKDYLLMFKNETHNHPTEIEPFGGAATCIGGAIRDPLSGRAYVYGGMRVTGSADPRQKIEDTMHGKLPQRKITTEAARGFSSYGNQIGLATGYVNEIYHSGYAAKRMELGAVIAAVPEENVIRKVPKPGDVVILLGGRTGRDGIGGASGSSKAHTDTSIKTCGAEVQKGNAITERKLQRLFRNPEAAKMILRCNDFGAGGVSVAIGELSDGIDIDLDKVPKKYEGLDGTEIAISESQERMAVVVKKEDAEKFKEFASKENIESTVVAVVTDKNRIVMNWKGKKIVDVSRDFLNTAGVKGSTNVLVKEPENVNFFNAKTEGTEAKEIILNKIQELNICSEKGLVQRFDGTIGHGSVLIPYGGKYQTTPAEGMVLKIPTSGETNTVSIMTCGYDPYLTSWSPFYGGMYSVIEAAAKNVCCGGDYKKIRTTLQEFFGKPEDNFEKWGKPYSALLGAYFMQKKLGMPAIGGKDSMSGSFNDMDVPPTIVTFAVCADKAQNVVSPEFKKEGSTIVLLKHNRLENDMPDIEGLSKIFETVKNLINGGKVLAASSVKNGGAVSEIIKMSLGNMIGFKFNGSFNKNLLNPDYGSIILEVSKDFNLKEELSGIDYLVLGDTNGEDCVSFEDCSIALSELKENYEKPLNGVFPIKAESEEKKLDDVNYHGGMKISPVIKTAKPKVLIPVFPGTNCEYDSARAFVRAGAEAETLVIRNRNSEDVLNSINELKEKIDKSNIVMLSGGFSAGDEPDGSGKFIAAVFRNPKITEAVMELLYKRDGLMFGICNGFQALIKLGLVPFGKIVDIDENSPSLTYNTIGRHISKVVDTKVVSNLSPWYSEMKVGDIHKVAISHGEGRFVYKEDKIKELLANGQVACRYVNFDGKPTMDSEYNPNGSILAVEAITSPDGRVLGKMGHSERYGTDLLKNIPGFNEEKIFESGVKYFK